MDITIKAGPFEVIASGIVITFKKNPIELTFGSPNKPMKLIMVFQDEEGKEEKRVKPNYIDANTLEVTFINFKNSVGTGSKEPIPFAKLEGRQLYLNYRIYSLPDADKTFHYTIYRGEEVV